MEHMEEKKFLSLLGLCRRAGRLVSGQEMVETGIRDGSALLVLVAADASDNTKKRFRDKCTYYEVPFYCVFSKEKIGAALGYELRAAVAVTDEGFAKKMTRLLNEVQSKDTAAGREV